MRQRVTSANGSALPAGLRRLDVPVEPGTLRLSLLLEGRRFAIHALDSLLAGGVVAILLPAQGVRPAQLVPVVVGLAAAALVAGLVVVLRRVRVEREGGGGTGDG